MTPHVSARAMCSPFWTGPRPKWDRRVTASAIGPLIEESRDLERSAGEIQGDRELMADDERIDELVSRYHEWYARCLDALPEGHEERFRGEFEGGVFSPKIKAFLQAPGD